MSVAKNFEILNNQKPPLEGAFNIYLVQWLSTHYNTFLFYRSSQGLQFNSDPGQVRKSSENHYKYFYSDNVAYTNTCKLERNSYEKDYLFDRFQIVDMS